MGFSLDYDTEKYWGAYFSGLSRDEAAAKYAEGHERVSRAYVEIETVVGPEGRLAHQLLRKLQKTNTNIQDALDGLEIKNTLADAGIHGTRNVEKLAKAITTKSRERGMSPERIVENAVKLLDIAEAANVPPEEMLGKLQKASEELATTNKSLEDTREKIDAAKAELDSRFKKNKITESDLDAFKNVREELKERNENISDTPILARLFKNAREKNHDLDQIVKSLGEIKSLNEQIVDLTEQLKIVRAALNTTTKEKAAMDDENEKSRSFHNRILELEVTGFDEKQLLKLKKKLVDISKEHNLESVKTVNAFFDDLEKYDAKVGFSLVLHNLESQFEKAKQNLEAFEQGLGAKKRAAVDLAKLESNGMRLEDIQGLKESFEASGVDFKTFLDDAKKYAHLEDLIDAKNLELAGAKKELLISKTSIEDLENRKQAVISSIETITTKALDKITETATTAKTEFSGVAATLTTAAKDTNKTAGDASKSVRDLLKRVEISIAEVSPMVEKFDKVLAAGREIGRLEFVAPALKIISGDETIPKYEALASLEIFTGKYISYFSRRPTEKKIVEEQLNHLQSAVAGELV
jgi:hypothetical protein